MKYNGIHRQQLFHWIGYHIDYPDPRRPQRRIPRLEDQHRLAYLDCLRGVLQRGKGLWVKAPRDPDEIGDGRLIKVDRPILCLTEWSLNESFPHTLRYGRLGLGFSKQFVLGKGGQPVAYVRDQKRNAPFARAMMALAQHFAELPATEVPGELHGSFSYVAHFLKSIRKKRAAVAKKRRVRRRVRARRVRVAPDPFKRTFGRSLEYLEEREWRIVFDESIRDQFLPGPGTPPWYLPMKPGTELFTVVLPDNRTMGMALDDATLRRRLFPKDAPPVTVLSLEDIGTF